VFVVAILNFVVLSDGNLIIFSPLKKSSNQKARGVRRPETATSTDVSKPVPIERYVDRLQMIMFPEAEETALLLHSRRAR